MQIIEDLWQAIVSIDAAKYPKLKDWNSNYFHEHKNRYIEDLKKIKEIHKGGKIIEIGSAPCHLAFLLKKLDLPVTGIDINPHRCESFINDHKLDVLKCDIEQEELPFENESINLIIFNETFEHLRINPIKTLESLNRVLSKTGTMMLTTPNLYSLKNIINFNLGRSTTDPFEEFQKLESVGHMGHIREYSSKEMTKFLEKTNFEVVQKEFKNYNKSKKRIVGSLINSLHFIIKKIRPYQVIVCKKI